jgi:hypothetical protein
LAGSELRCERADQAVAGAGGVDRFHAAARNDRCVAIDHRQHAAAAEGHAHGLVRSRSQRPHGLDEARIVVGIPKLGRGEKPEFGFVENEHVDEIEQRLPKF